MKELVRKFWLLGLVLVLAFGLSIVACGGGGDDDDTDDDNIPDDDSDDDIIDDDDDDECDPDISTPVWDFHAICHATPQGIDECDETSNEKDINLEDMYDSGTQTGWGVFVQYTDNGCDLGYYVHKDGSKEEVLEGTECGTGSDMGVFFSWSYDALETECNNTGGPIALNDSLQLLDFCNFTSDVWEFTINVICPE